MKVCSVQEHLELGGSEMKVHQIAINPLLGHFAAVLMGGPSLWRGAGTLVLCSQLAKLFNQVCN